MVSRLNSRLDHLDASLDERNAQKVPARNVATATATAAPSDPPPGFQARLSKAFFVGTVRAFPQRKIAGSEGPMSSTTSSTKEWVGIVAWTP